MYVIPGKVRISVFSSVLSISAAYTPAEVSDEMDKPWQFVVYRNELGNVFDKENSKHMYCITKEREIKFDRINSKKKKYEVRISVLDRLNNESKLSVPVVVKM